MCDDKSSGGNCDSRYTEAPPSGPSAWLVHGLESLAQDRGATRPAEPVEQTWLDVVIDVIKELGFREVCLCQRLILPSAIGAILRFGMYARRCKQSGAQLRAQR